MNRKLKFLLGSPACDLKTKTALFSVSLRPFSKLTELGLIIEKAINTFGTCHISLCDSLQRYNLIWQKGMTIESAHQYTNRLGREWTEWLYDFFSNSSLVKPKVISWDSWLKNPKYSEKRHFVDTCYEQDANFREAVYISLTRYLDRVAEHHPDFDRVQAESLSIEFVKEETAVFFLQSDEGYDFEIFLEKRNPGLQYFYDNILWKKNPEFLQPVLTKINF